jgi:5-formyltetrahydrofolate cyclo-ligase
LTSKSALRDLALRRRDQTGADFRAAASAAIAGRAAPLIAAFSPRRVAAYVAMRSEVDPRPLIEAIAPFAGEIGLPVIEPGRTLSFRRFVPGDRLVPGGFGTLVPDEDAPVIDPDLIIVPTVAFDRAGTRLGYGKGHYDRAIAALRASGRRATLVGIAFAVQEVDRIPREPHDVTLDFIATEAETLGPFNHRP